jgi:hypothetical protein
MYYIAIDLGLVSLLQEDDMMFLTQKVATHDTSVK